jgi:IS5 family transposase
LGRAPASDETTTLNLYRLLEEQRLYRRMPNRVNIYLEGCGIHVASGTIAEATMVYAPSLTKDDENELDSAMHRARKHNPWYFGMKAQIGVDSIDGIVPSVCSTAASVSDMDMLPGLLHCDEKKVGGDACSQGQTEVIHVAVPYAQDMISRRARYKGRVDKLVGGKDLTRARVHSKVEVFFQVLKRLFGFVKVRYRGLKRKHECLCAAFAAINVY